MAQASDIRPHMEVRDADGVAIGTVDGVEGDRIKLTRRDAADGHHHQVALADVSRVDAHVHLARTAAALGLATTASGHEGVLPPVHNRAVEDAPARRNFYLPWIVGVIGVVLLVLLFRGCAAQAPETTTSVEPGTPATAPLGVEQVTLPNGATVALAPDTLNYSLQRFLASAEPTPRTFAFDKLNFDTGSSAIRAEDAANVDALAQVLAAYPAARGDVVGYTDARGTGGSNAALGQQRAESVVAALVAKGVARERLNPRSGGEANATETNATAAGRFENRRTELTITAK